MNLFDGNDALTTGSKEAAGVSSPFGLDAGVLELELEDDDGEPEENHEEIDMVKYEDG